MEPQTPKETPPEDLRRLRATEIVERALVAANTGDEPPIKRLIAALVDEVAHVLLDVDRKALELKGLVEENEKIRTVIAGNEREVPAEVTVAEQTRALLEILHEAHRRASGGRLRSLALFWREGREVFVRANTRGVVARPGDRDATLVGMHGNFPWAAYFDGKETVAIRFGTIGSTNVLWERKYQIGPSRPLHDLPAAVQQAQSDFDSAMTA